MKNLSQIFMVALRSVKIYSHQGAEIINEHDDRFSISFQNNRECIGMTHTV